MTDDYRPVYLRTATDGMLAFLHPAPERNGARPPSAVLFCPPFGYDDMCSYRVRRAWAIELAAGGHASLRMDLPGTGDSGGGPRDPGRLAAWVDAVAVAARWLRAESGADRVVALGIGLGGLLAMRAAAGGAAIDDLVLWGAPARGRDLVRELRAFAGLGISGVDEYAFDPALMPPLPDGAIDSGGFLLSAETVRDLEALDLTRLVLPDAAARRVLLLERDGMSVDERFRGSLQEAGTAVTVAPGPGYGAMMNEPHLVAPPTEVFAQVAAWLAAPAPSAAAPNGAPATDEPVAASASLEIMVGTARVRERPVLLEREEGRLFAVVTEPETRAAEFCAVLLNSGAERHIGPNRMWVELARRWAAQGIPVVRLDLVGIGDADGELNPWTTRLALYRPAIVTQIRDALDALEAQGLPNRVLLVGLCSGAYWAFNAALSDARVTTAFLINSRMMTWDPLHGSVAQVRHLGQLRRAGAWRRLVRGEISWEGVRIKLRALAQVLAGTSAMRAARRRARRTGGDELDHALDELRDRGTRIRMWFTSGEPLHADWEREGRLGRFDRWPNVTIVAVSGPSDTHTLQVVRLQPYLHSLLDEALAQELAVLAPQARSGVS